MKKVYTLAAAMLVSGLAYAHTADKAVAELSRPQEYPAKALDLNFGAPAKKANKKSTRAEEWKSIGEGNCRDFLVSCLVKMDAEVFQIEIEQNVGDPTQYRVKDMYKNFDYAGLEEIFQFEAGDNYVYISTYTAPDGKTVWWIPGSFEDNNTGLYAAIPLFKDEVGPSGFAQLNHLLSSMIESQGVETVYQKFPVAFGTFENGVFTCPAKPKGMSWSDGSPVDYIIFCHFSNLQPGYGFYANDKGQLTITLPGVEMPAPADPFESYTLLGECDMFNSILDNLFDEYNAKVAKVQVYEDQKGFFHIKNAWLDGSWNTPEQAAEVDFSIDLRDPGFGIIDWQSTGYYDEIEASSVDIMSKSAGMMRHIKNTLTKEEIMALEYFNEINVYLDTTNKKIVIPGYSIWYYLPDVAESSQYYGQLFSASENAKESYVQLPADYVAPAAVNEIASEEFDGPTRYFNLQGVEVAAPAKGDLVIKKNGSKASKVIF